MNGRTLTATFTFSAIVVEPRTLVEENTVGLLYIVRLPVTFCNIIMEQDLYSNLPKKQTMTAAMTL